jgi:hypothetical protein
MRRAVLIALLSFSFAACLDVKNDATVQQLETGASITLAHTPGVAGSYGQANDSELRDSQNRADENVPLDADDNPSPRSAENAPSMGEEGGIGIGSLPETGQIGASCDVPQDCEDHPSECMELPGGYCVVKDCTEDEFADSCPQGSVCHHFQDAQTFCLDRCESHDDCRQDEGYICESDGICWSADFSSGNVLSAVGGPCASSADCLDPDASCYPESLQGKSTGFINGYCMIFGCSAQSCPNDSVCVSLNDGTTTACLASYEKDDGCPQGEGYGRADWGDICWPRCDGDDDCPAGSGCHPEQDYCVSGWSNKPFQCLDQTGEPNETPQFAKTLLVPGSWTELQLCEDDTDWYVVNIPEGHLGTVGVSFHHAMGDLDLLLYDPFGQFLGSRLPHETYGETLRSHENNYEFLSIMNLNGPAVGYYKVQGWNGAQNTYSLEVETTPWQDDLHCTDHFDFDACRGYDGTAEGELLQVPVPSPNDPYVPNGYVLDSLASYRWLRRETMMLIRYAIHEVQQRFADTQPLGLIDMSDKHSLTPGVDVGSPRHPETTHDQGGNVDIAYYQTDGDSVAESVCGPNGSDHDGYYCTSVDNHIMDVPRTTYFMAMLAKHSRLRAIGIDPLLAPMILTEAEALRDAGEISETVYANLTDRLAYGQGWPFHHHHMHLSMRWWNQDSPSFTQLVVANEAPVGCGYRMIGDGE